MKWRLERCSRRLRHNKHRIMERKHARGMEPVSRPSVSRAVQELNVVGIYSRGKSDLLPQGIELRSKNTDQESWISWYVLLCRVSVSINDDREVAARGGISVQQFRNVAADAAPDR